MVHRWGAPPDPDLVPVIRKEAVPGQEIRTASEEGTWNRFSASLRTFYDRYIAGYAWDQVDRLREAKLREIESLSEERSAVAAMRLAEARRMEAEAELLYAQAEAARLSAHEKRLELAEKEAALRDAILRIQDKGGSVSFVPEVQELEES